MSFAKYDENGKTVKNSDKHVIDCQKAIENGEKYLVEQSHKAEVDINQIVKRHGGRVELIAATQNIQQMRFDDNPTNDFQEMMTMMIKGREAFESLPSEVRNHFGNDPAEYMDFVRNPENEPQLRDWGLMNPPEPDPVPVQVEVVNPTAETPPEGA